ncbi:hypothetical protein D5086_014961 [Populus alba]|uniref:Uncharacterized protein n=1 Tax=Populus alba TaxID=43335 RepID=A0ACC4BZS3_POPAL
MTIVPKKGKVSLVSQSGVHQRRIFIFVLAAFHVIYSVVIIDLAKAKVILIVGAKLEIIIMEMAREIQDKTAVVKGVPVVEPSNKYFWFNRPDIILFFIHFTLFQVIFTLNNLSRLGYKFGLKSCYHDNLLEMLARVVLAIILQFLCSYVTFPLYALVTQMGSHMKKAIFEEQTSKAIKKWQKSAKERSRLKNKAVADGSSNGFSVMSADHQSGALSRGTSPLHLLHKFKHNSTDIEGGLSTCTSPRSCYSETELSEIEGAAPSSDDYELRRQNNPKRLEESRSADFSFAMP